MDAGARPDVRRGTPGGWRRPDTSRVDVTLTGEPDPAAEGVAAASGTPTPKPTARTRPPMAGWWGWRADRGNRIFEARPSRGEFHQPFPRSGAAIPGQIAPAADLAELAIAI